MNREEWYGHLTDLGCIACAIEAYGRLEPQRMAEVLLDSPSTPAQIHHDRHGVGMGKKAKWERTIPLCYNHHEGGWVLPSAHFGVKDNTLVGFEKRYGTVEELNEYCQEIVAYKMKMEALW